MRSLALRDDIYLLYLSDGEQTGGLIWSPWNQRCLSFEGACVKVKLIDQEEKLDKIPTHQVKRWLEDLWINSWYLFIYCIGISLDKIFFKKNTKFIIFCLIYGTSSFLFYYNCSMFKSLNDIQNLKSFLWSKESRWS